MNKSIGLLALTMLLLVQPASALPLWELEGARGRVQLLGSIHFLRPSDFPLPAAMERAYDEADVLVMEIDMDNAIAARKAINEEEGVRISFNDMVVKAVAMSLTQRLLKTPCVKSYFVKN